MLRFTPLLAANPFTIDAAAITAIVGIITLILQNIFAARTAERNHRFEMEDRAAKLKEQRELTEREALITRVALERRASTIHADSVRRTEEVKSLLAENTEVSKSAFKEANNVNQKIAELGLQHLAAQSKLQVDEMQHVAEDTNVRVRRIEDATATTVEDPKKS